MVGLVSVAVDVGGTFTDIIALDRRSGQLSVLKFPTAPDPAGAVSDGLTKLGVSPGGVSTFSHATTLATNALLTRTGLGRPALVTNSGFRDILEIGRQRRPELYNLETRRPSPLVPRKDRHTVGVRLSFDGSEVTPLDTSEVKGVCAKIIGRGYTAVAVSFLHSYANGKHEREVRDALREGGFGGPISISSDVDPEYREYERTSTTVVNAALAPLMEGYLGRLSKSLAANGLRSPVYVMGSDGGSTTVEFASRNPVGILESGPAAGVVASKALANRLRLDRVLSFDMGGTTAKAGAVIDGDPDYTSEFEAAGRTHSGRSIKGSGYPVRGRFIDLAEVSAGGGTIAWVDDAGDLMAGPRSAGSHPGPACYGRGGTEPTVTDANLLLGRLSPASLVGGSLRIRADLAERAISRLSKELRQGPGETSKGILRLVNDSMARAVSIVSVERGRDPREFTMMAFGGAGPMHCCDLAESLGVREVMVPAHAGLFSAYGLLVGELSRSFVDPIMSTRTNLRSRFERLEERAQKEMEKERLPKISFERSFDARYLGQSHELTLRYQADSSVGPSFSRLHRAIYGYSIDDPVEVVSIRVRASVRRKPDIPPRQEPVVPSVPKSRKAWVGGKTSVIPVLRRESIGSGQRGEGPCIIEEYDSTLVVNPSWKWRRRDWGMKLSR